MQPDFLPEMVGDRTAVWEDFDELNDPDPNPDDEYWMSVERRKELAGKDESLPNAND